MYELRVSVVGEEEGVFGSKAPREPRVGIPQQRVHVVLVAAHDDRNVLPGGTLHLMRGVIGWQSEAIRWQFVRHQMVIRWKSGYLLHNGIDDIRAEGVGRALRVEAVALVDQQHLWGGEGVVVSTCSRRGEHLHALGLFGSSMSRTLPRHASSSSTVLRSLSPTAEPKKSEGPLTTT